MTASPPTRTQIIRKAHIRGWTNRNKHLDVHRDGSKIFTRPNDEGWTLKFPNGTTIGQFTFSHQARAAHADLRLMSK